jgi:hypothetical protein
MTGTGERPPTKRLYPSSEPCSVRMKSPEPNVRDRALGARIRAAIHIDRTGPIERHHASS